MVLSSLFFLCHHKRFDQINNSDLKKHTRITMSIADQEDVPYDGLRTGLGIDPKYACRRTVVCTLVAPPVAPSLDICRRSIDPNDAQLEQEECGVAQQVAQHLM